MASFSLYAPVAAPSDAELGLARIAFLTESLLAEAQDFLDEGHDLEPVLRQELVWLAQTLSRSMLDAELDGPTRALVSSMTVSVS